MAARRLLVVMLVFLAISTVLAALAPRAVDDDPETTTTEATTEPEPDGADDGGRLIRRELLVSQSSGRLSADPDRVEVETGDQLALTVRVPATLTLAIPSLGLTDTGAPGGPARFDLLLTAPGQHRLVELTTGRVLARVVVRVKDEP